MLVHEAIGALRLGRWSRWLLHAALLGLLLPWCLIPGAQAQFTRFQNLTDEQGLGNLTVYALAQDRDGYLLIGTEAGLYRYDGVGITADDAGLPSASWIQQIVSDQTGRVWIVTADGLYVRRGPGFSRVETGTTAHLQSAHLLAATATRVALDAGGTLLAAPVGAGMVGRFSPLFDAATLARVPELARARFVSPDTGDGLLIGCGVSICREAGNRVAVLGDADGLPADIWQVAIRTPDGTLWARSLDRIAWRRPGRTRFEVAVLPGARDPGMARPGEHTSYVAHPERLGLLDDRHGGVLTQSAGGLIDWNGTTWRMYAHHAGGLPTNRLQAFMFDREGSLWVGSFGTGVFRSIGMDSWEHWTADDVLPSNIVWSMTRLANRKLWVATDSGTVAIGSAASSISAETNYVAQATAAGRVWLAPVGAPLTRIDPARNLVERFASVGRVVTADLDRTGRLWLCTPGGLFMVSQPDAPAPDVHPELVLAHDVQQVTTDPSGAVWALSADGVFRRDGSGRFDLVVPPALLRSAPFALTFTPGGELWVGTESTGVLRFRVTGSQVEPLPSLVSPVIGSNNVLFAHRDRRGWIWLGSDHGIDMFDGRSWRRFDGSDGPITNDMNQAAVYEDTDGSMWFGTSHGLSHLVDPTLRPPPAMLHPLVTGLSFDNRSLALAPSIRTHWSAASLTIRFVDLDYTHGRNIAFRYRLDGLDSGWSSTTEHEVRYAGLPPGTLRFELVAVDTVHGRASAPVGFTLHIRAPWWRRWWFYGLCAVAATVILVGTWQVRIRLLLRQKRRLEELVGARTAEIEAAQRELQRQVLSDVLTGLANRRAIMDALEQAVAAAQHTGAPLAILLCDIDHFKKINDGFGHLAGDQVLTAFGARLGAAISPPEAAGRYGGEEFLVILHGEPDAVLRSVSAIHRAITASPYDVGDVKRPVTSSGGLAFLHTEDNALSLVARADAALYRAKENGRNRVEDERSLDGSRLPALEMVPVRNLPNPSAGDADAWSRLRSLAPG